MTVDGLAEVSEALLGGVSAKCTDAEHLAWPMVFGTHPLTLPRFLDGQLQIELNGNIVRTHLLLPLSCFLSHEVEELKMHLHQVCRRCHIAGYRIATAASGSIPQDDRGIDA